MRAIWDEPVRGGYVDPGWLGLSGSERVRIGTSMRVMPPAPTHHLTGMRPVAGTDGLAEWELPPSPWFQSYPGGPYLASMSAFLADSPLGGVVMSVQPPGSYVNSSELSISFLRPATVEGGALTARARLIDAGRSVGLSEAVVTDARGRTIAHTTSRLFVRRIEPVPPPPASLEPFVHETYDTPDPYLRPMPAEMLSRPDLSGRSGLEIFRAVAAGELPHGPFAELFGIRFREATEGSASLVVRASEWLNSGARAIYGGVLVVLADAAMAAAVTTTMPAGSSFATLDVKVQFVRPGIADGRELEVRGEVVHRGRTMAVTRGAVLNADGKPVVLATGSSIIRPDRPWEPITVADEDQPEED